MNRKADFFYKTNRFESRIGMLYREAENLTDIAVKSDRRRMAVYRPRLCI